MGAAAADGLVSTSDALAWFERQRAERAGDVERVPLSDLNEWKLAPDLMRLYHSSGRFFRVEGYRATSTAGPVEPFQTRHLPLINQPEVGILGFLTTVVDGVRHYYVQAKMEPGNVAQVQLAPTVQATHSNYTRVHRGKATDFLDYFLGRRGAKVVADELQPEQASYFLGKWNRNMIVEIDKQLPERDDFRWLTFAQLALFLRVPFMVNMDARSVLSCCPLPDGPDSDGFGGAALRSARPADNGHGDSSGVRTWLLKRLHRACVRLAPTPLDRLQGWYFDSSILRRADGEESVIGVMVQAATREVSSWQQPMLRREYVGLLGMLLQVRQGVLHLLVQVTVDAGCTTTVQISPTVVRHGPDHPVDEALCGWFAPGSAGTVRFDAMQSEEGGRLHEIRYRYQLIEAPAGVEVAPSPAHRWVTLAELDSLRRTGLVSIEVRNLLACLHAVVADA